jgi:RNA polymerase sigma-70 factor (ECF subfamily)
MKAPLGTQEVQLVSAVLTPDDAAEAEVACPPTLAEVYRRHAADVGRWAARLGGPRIDVDDVVQEVFLVVNRQLPQFRGEAKLTTWLFRITDRVVRNHRRWRAVRRIVTRLTARLGDRLASTEDDAFQTLQRHAEVKAAYRVLDQLPEKYRRVLILSELEEMPAEEIARLLDARIETVRVWLHRGRRMFLERVRREGELDEGESDEGKRTS